MQWPVPTAYLSCCDAICGIAPKDDVGELDTGLALQELEAPNAGPPKNNIGVQARKLSKPTVFIVDDDDACRDSVRELVIAVGLAAAVFSSAFEFLAAFDATWRGCLVLDVRMPRMNGSRCS
jgi:PleD family two-component response regulator